MDDPSIHASFEPLLKDLQLTGFEDQTAKRVLVAKHIMAKCKHVTLRPLLPLLLNIKGKPYTLTDYFPFEPFFRTRLSRKFLLKTGRQVSKSTSLAARGIVQSNCEPYFNTLYITPLFEMIRRFSQNYVRPFIETSPVSKLFTGTQTINSVLQKSFRNRSQMIFSFAYLDAERTRGISADQTVYDEVQDLNIDYIPIIRETMSGSKKWGLETFAGTPKSLENTIESLWQDCSMAEWCIKCHHAGCGHWNIPALSHDLDDMIGPLHSGISEKCPALVCAKCRKPLQPRSGRWVHAKPEMRWEFTGYHVPQVIMPMHYANPEKWAVLLGKRAGSGNTSINVYYNEVCGESYDIGAKLVSLTELKKAANLPWRARVDEAVKQVDRYTHRVLSVDWGGGGEKGVSFTTLAILGMRSDGVVDVLYGLRSLRPHDHIYEAKLCLNALAKFKCQVLVHDFNGAGSLRETFINQAGWPLNKIIPIAYIPAGRGKIIRYKPETVQVTRGHHQVDRTRSLLLTCQQIKMGWLNFFEYDFVNQDNPGLIRDFLALIENKVDSRTGRDIYQILRDPNKPDDFAQAVNMGLMALYHMTDKWPNLATIDRYQLDDQAMRAMYPIEGKEWDDI